MTSRFLVLMARLQRALPRYATPLGLRDESPPATPVIHAAARLGYVPSRRRLLAVISRPVPTMPNVPSAHHAHQIPPMSMSQGLINMLRPSDPGASHNADRDCTKALISPAADLHRLSTGIAGRNANDRPVSPAIDVGNHLSSSPAC